MDASNNRYPGNGTIKCRECGESLRDHPIRPCASLGMSTIYAAPIRVYKDAGAAENMRARRAKAKAAS